MSSGATTLAKTTHHSEHLADRGAMLVMRTMIGLQPPAALGSAGRTAFDELMTKTPSAEDVTYESTVVGGVAGWWCHRADAVAAARSFTFMAVPMLSDRRKPVDILQGRSHRALGRLHSDLKNL